MGETDKKASSSSPSSSSTIRTTSPNTVSPYSLWFWRPQTIKPSNDDDLMTNADSNSSDKSNTSAASKPRHRLSRILRLFTASASPALPPTGASAEVDQEILENKASEGTDQSQTSVPDNEEASSSVAVQDKPEAEAPASSSWFSSPAPSVPANTSEEQGPNPTARPTKPSHPDGGASLASLPSQPTEASHSMESSTASPSSASGGSWFQAVSEFFAPNTASELDRLLELIRLLSKTRFTPSIFQKLLEGTKDEAWTVRKLACQGLGCLQHLGKLDESSAALAGKHVLQGIADHHWEVRESAARALCFFGGVVGPDPEISEALGAERFWPVRVALLQASPKLGCSGISAEHLEAIVNALGDDEWKVRMSAATAVAQLGLPSAQPALEPCLAACQDLNWQVRRAVLAALTALAAAAPESVEAAVLAGLDDRAWEVRQAAAWHITELPSIRSNKVAACLARRLTDQEERVAIASAHALGSLGPAAASHFAAILKLLQHETRALREAAKRALWQAAGCDMAAATHAVSSGKLPDHFSTVTETWLRRVDPAAKSFTKQLGSHSEELRSSAARALFGLGLLAVYTLVQDVMSTPVTRFEERMRLMRALSCTGYLPSTLACSFLAEWIYTPVLDQMPLQGLTLLVLQEPQPRQGFNLQWALLKNDEGDCYLTFRGSETGLDWLENGNISLRRVHLPELGTFLVHGGYWSSVEGESSRILAALTKAARNRPIRRLFLTGGSKGGANAMAAAIWLLFHRHEADTLFHELSVIVFGTPNIVGKGDQHDSDVYAWKRVREKMYQLAPRSRSWVFPMDPVVAIAGGKAQDVTTFYGKSADKVRRIFKWWSPQGYDKIAGYVDHVTEVASTLVPVVPEEELSLDPKRGGDQYDASVHPQVNYTEALCRRWISDGLEPRQI